MLAVEPYPYVELDPASGAARLLPYLPITLTASEPDIQAS